MTQRQGRFELAHRGTLLPRRDRRPRRSICRPSCCACAAGRQRSSASDPRRRRRWTCASWPRRIATCDSDDVRKDTFREDLYYRLERLPDPAARAARQRPEDIPRARVVDHPASGSGSLHRAHHAQCRPAVMERAAAAREWPGNVRELENVIERALIHDRRGADTARGRRRDQQPPVGGGTERRSPRSSAHIRTRCALRDGGSTARATRPNASACIPTRCASMNEVSASSGKAPPGRALTSRAPDRHDVSPQAVTGAPRTARARAISTSSPPVARGSQHLHSGRSTMPERGPKKFITNVTILSLASPAGTRVAGAQSMRHDTPPRRRHQSGDDSEHSPDGGWPRAHTTPTGARLVLISRRSGSWLSRRHDAIRRGSRISQRANRRRRSARSASKATPASRSPTVSSASRSS